MFNGLWYLKTPKFSYGPNRKQLKHNLKSAINLLVQKKSMALNMVLKVIDKISNRGKN